MDDDDMKVDQVKKQDKRAAIRKRFRYEFGGPLGTSAMTLGLPVLCFLTTFLCNDIAGCPIPCILHPSTFTWQLFKEESGWPRDALYGFTNRTVVAWVLGYHALSVVMQLGLPGQEVEGVELRSGGRLKYKFNALVSAVVILTAVLVGTLTEGADFVAWSFIWDNYLAILTTNVALAFALASFVYVRSFGVRRGNGEKRELAAGGVSGTIIYDWFIGRELNPRIEVPFLGTIDIKALCELRPGMLGWLLLDYAFVAHQYKRYGYVTDSIVLIAFFQSIYVLDAVWNEAAVLTTMDITTDGFGFMLAFADLVWVPFVYSLQTRYLATHPVQLGLWGTAGVLAVQAVGYYIFRSANNEKNRFRTDPADPRVAHLEHMDTAAGTKLLVSGWWGGARHINYLGDWIMAWAWCLPTGLAGYLVRRTVPPNFPGGTAPVEYNIAIVPADARPWGMLFTYFYVLYFAVLLVHRELRDEEKCEKKYGADWEKYKARVPSRIIPGIY
ncbi:MAG: erg24, C-14 sterol reductase [Lichina confinis]|nr:MAG: erg24, C-14 sterol reductase [Lichina confinis]